MDNFEYNYEYNFGHVLRSVYSEDIWSMKSVQILQQRHQNNFNDVIWCLYSEPWTDFTHCYEVSIADFEQINAG